VYYNFARIHKTLRIAPAMAAGQSDQFGVLRRLFFSVSKSDMARREIAFLLIGLGLGLLLSLAVVLEIFTSLYHNQAISSYGFDKFVLIIPILPLLAGITLLAYRTKSERTSN
jgi:hypothetical protein